MKNLLYVTMIYLVFPLLLVCFIQKNTVWNNIDTDTALAYLLYLECPKESCYEAIKAQTVLLRSNLSLFSKEEWNELIKKSASIEQKKEYKKVKNTYFTAIADTENLVLKSNGKIIRGVYHEISAGMTRDGTYTGKKEYEQLSSVVSSWDMQSPGYLQVFSFSDQYLKHHFFENQDDPQISVLLVDNGEYVQMAQWGNTYVNGDFVRDSLSLPSAAFTIIYQDKQWIFTCKGVGHGLGMSLYGANVLAKQGKTFQEILKYYFPNYDILSK